MNAAQPARRRPRLQAITLARSYEPFGDTLAFSGTGTTAFQFTGEQRDATGLTYLRARYLSTSAGRFVTRDVWEGDPNRPMSYNAWLYAAASPLTRVDPSGHREDEGGDCNVLPGTKKLECQLTQYRLGRGNIRWATPPGLHWIGPVGLPPVSDLAAEGWVNRPGAQFHVPGHLQYWANASNERYDSEGNRYTGDDLDAYSWWGNLCGQVSLAAILHRPAQEVVEAFQEANPLWMPYQFSHTDQLIDLVNSEYGDEWRATSYRYVSASNLRSYISAESSRRYVLPLVAISNGGSGPAGGTVGLPRFTDHWVVLTGLSREWRQPEDSILNWVRIFNPFTNGTEYYPWGMFEEAWDESEGNHEAFSLERR